MEMEQEKLNNMGKNTQLSLEEQAAKLENIQNNFMYFLGEYSTFLSTVKESTTNKTKESEPVSNPKDSNDDVLTKYITIRGKCTDLFRSKTYDYGASWKLFRDTSISDQIFTKLKRIYTLETTKENKVGDSIEGELIAVVNYCIIGQMLINKDVVASDEEVINTHDHYFDEAYKLMLEKNHDYGDAWEDMYCSTLTDMMLVKMARVKNLQKRRDKYRVSEGVCANYVDILNYSIFYMIKKGWVK